MITVDPVPPHAMAQALAREAASALEWWALAGLDWNMGDEAKALWANAAPTARNPVTDASAPSPDVRPAPDIGLPAAEMRSGRPAALGRAAERPPITLGDSPPEDLLAFRTWWLTEPTLDLARLHPRVPPRGEAGARLMVLVSDPEEGDGERLLGQAQGRFLAAMLRAMGVSEAETYVASALPSHMPMADLARLAEQGLDRVLAHHLRLAAPARLMVFGTRLAPLVESPAVRMVTGGLPVTINQDLPSIMGTPQLKARLWRRWIEWTAE